MKILADYHHSDLFESYQLTLQDRFGWTIYRPIGMEWFHQDIYQFERKFHGDAVAKQYLMPWDGDTDVRVDSTHPGRVHNLLTLGQAIDIKPDIVIASVPDNEPGFAQFAKKIGAHYGVQIGNNLQLVNWDLAEFGLVSSTLDYRPPKPHVIYRQEFRLEDFRYEPPPRENVIGSFVQCFPENPKSYAEFLGYARERTEFDWRVYGAYGTHPVDEFATGNLPSTPAVAEAMRATDIIWHAKEWSDGYGHVVHNAFAVGRPVVGHKNYYADKLAGPLWIDGETCIDLDAHPRSDVLRALDNIRNDPDLHRRLCENSARRFREVVNFDEDAAKVKELLEKIAS